MSHTEPPSAQSASRWPCHFCGTTVWLNSRGVVVEHMKPRTGPIPEGCKASNHRRHPVLVPTFADGGGAGHAIRVWPSNPAVPDQNQRSTEDR